MDKKVWIITGSNRGLGRAFAKEVAAICPGSFRTDFRDKSSLKTPENPMAEYDGTAAHDVVKFLSKATRRRRRNLFAILWSRKICRCIF